MEDITGDFAPMLTFATTDSMDAASGYYYQSAGSSPIMASNSFESSPGQSPQFYGSFEASPQYYLDNSLDQSPSSQYQIQFQSQQPRESFVIQKAKSFSGSNMLNGNASLESANHQSQSLQIPGINELSQLFNMARKVEDKLAIQAKIKQILFEHLKPHDSSAMSYVSGQNGQQSALITPPLSPNADNLMYMGKQNPMFTVKQCSSLKPVPTMPMNPMVKVEPLSPVHVPQQPISRKISRSSFIDATTAANVISTDTGLLVGGGQSPAVINSTVAQNSCNPKTIYFETTANQQVQYGQYKLDTTPSIAGFSSNMPILVSEPTSISDTVPLDDSQHSELKTIVVAKPKSKSKSKAKSKKSSEQKQPPTGTPKQSQKRSAHLSAEFRYRTKLNDKISKLRSLVGQKVHLSKSAVLSRSIERIIKLQKLTIRLHESNLRLQSLVAKYTNPPNLLPPTENSSKLMSIKELTRSLSTGSCTNLSQSAIPGQSIDIDLAKFIDSQMMVESEPIPATIEPTLNAPMSLNSSTGLATEEVFDFDQFLEQF